MGIVKVWGWEWSEDGSGLGMGVVRGLAVICAPLLVQGKKGQLLLYRDSASQILGSKSRSL